MNILTLELPDDLTPQEEAARIAGALLKHSLGKGQKLLAGEIEIKDLNTGLIIRRVPKKSAPLVSCSVCKSLFDKKQGAVLWVNYGGIPKRLIYCTDGCRKQVLDVCGEGRAAINKRGLVHHFQQARAAD